MGVDISQENDSTTIVLRAKGPLKAIEYMATGPYPSFPTDMQPQFTALLATAKGDSIMSERVFESRDKHVAELVAMGADIRNVEGRRFHIKGAEQLYGAEVHAHDLRGGAALILAGLAAEGKTIVKNSVYVERGYEAIHEDLQALGADIRFLSGGA
jgi:UDP-N-acetylglucosamine 1-carboxyvinyltransferase